jgi:hypothetical protein
MKVTPWSRIRGIDNDTRPEKLFEADLFKHSHTKRVKFEAGKAAKKGARRAVVVQ